MVCAKRDLTLEVLTVKWQNMHTSERQGSLVRWFNELFLRLVIENFWLPSVGLTELLQVAKSSHGKMSKLRRRFGRHPSSTMNS